MADMADWLDRAGLRQYAELFVKNAIDVDVLPELEDADLKDLGIPLGHRKKLLKAFRDLDESPPRPAGRQPAASTQEPERGTDIERRQLTVMFADLVGSTALSQRLDPEDFREIIRSFQEACTRVVQEQGGYVAKHLGDGLLAYFGYPKAQEDDAERAVRAGLAMARAVGALKAPEPLEVRAGLETGLVIVGGMVGEGMSQEAEISGDTPNLAGRLQQLAKPGQVVVGPTLRSVVRGVFELEDLGHHELKGIAGSISASRVVSEVRAESRFEARQTEGITAFIGREDEMYLLMRRWEQARAGEGQVVLISGEPGIGKSRLTQELRARVKDEPHMRLHYQCSPHQTNSTLYPVISQLIFAARIEDQDADGTKLDKLEAVLSRATDNVDGVMALLADLLSIPAGDRYPELNYSPQRRKDEILDAWTDQLSGFAAEHPVLVIFEDVHWIDPTTQELLDLAVERVVDEHVLMLITFRPEHEPRWVGEAHVTALNLNRLNKRLATEMAANLARTSLPEDVITDIVAKTEGVPLFLEELTKAVLEADESAPGTDVQAALQVPATLKDSLTARLDRLISAKEVAQLGSVIGRTFPHALLAAISDRGEDELQTALARLCGAGLVFQHGNPPDARYSFKHALVQDAAYDSILKTRRRELHGSLGNFLEQRRSEGHTVEPALLAHHFAEARETLKAIDYWEQAAHAAIRASAEIEAERALQSAITLIGTLEPSASTQRRELEFQLTLGTVQSATQGFGSPGSLAAFRRLVEMAERAGSPTHRIRALVGYANAHLNTAARAEPILREALALAESADLVHEAVYCRCYLALSIYVQGRFEECLAIREAGFAAYRPEEYQKHHPDDAVVLLDGYRSIDLVILGYGDRALRIKQAAIEAGRKNPHAHSRCFAYIMSTVFHCYRREGVLALDDAKEAMVIADEHRFGFWVHHGPLYVAWALTLLGQGPGQIDALRAHMRSLRDKELHMAWHLFSSVLGEALIQASRPSDAVIVLDEGLENVRATDGGLWEPELHRLRARALAASGVDESEVEVALGRAIDVARTQRARMLELRATIDLARRWQGLDRTDEARDRLASICAWFTEGFDTPDLKHAKALLDEIS